MIHRHKHEMTLKFPSIKNDNMLSGEVHDAAAAGYTRKVHPERSFAGVHAGDSCPDRRARLSSRKLNSTAMLAVYDDLNHTTGPFLSALTGFERVRHGDAGESACQSLSSSSPFMKKGVDIALN